MAKHRRRSDIVQTVIALANRHFTPDQIVICLGLGPQAIGAILAKAQRAGLLTPGFVIRQRTVMAQWGQ